MAGKRSATSELNHENWDLDDDVEEAGTFKRASDDVIKQRVIKTARRRHNPSHESATSGGGSNIFGGFSFASSGTNNAQTAFSFLNNTSNAKPVVPPAAPIPPPKTEEKQEANTSNNTYLAKLKGLNQSVAAWIKQHVDSNPFVNLKPIFTDYEKYFKEIDRIGLVQEVSAATKKELSAFAFKSPEKTDEKKLDVASTTTSTPKFSFGIKPASDTQSEFAAKPPFIFGGGGSMTIPSPPTTQATQKQNDAEEDEDQPPQNEFTPVEEPDSVYSTRCKVFVRKDGQFGDRGVGRLFLKPISSSEKVQLIVRADTSLGNLLCNFVLSKSMPMQRAGKKDVMLVCVPTADAQPPPVPILLRVKSDVEADALLRALESHRK